MLKIGNIFCPLDLTSESTEALRYAFALAKAYSAKLFLCHCKEKYAGSYHLFTAKDTVREVFEETVRKYRSGFAGVETEIMIIEETDDVASKIVKMAADLNIDLIIMRSRRRPRSAALLGSIAETVCRTAPCPVFVTHPQEREWQGLNSDKLQVQRVLVAYDYSDDSERSLNYGISLAQEYGAELHLLHVLQPPSDEGPEIAWSGAGSEAIYKNAINRLRKAALNESQNWSDVKMIVRWGKPYRETLIYAQENEIDLICMGAKGRNFGLGTLFGSNVDRVLRQSPCPVLVGRPLKPSVETVSLKSKRSEG